jgi:hypothetical protein
MTPDKIAPPPALPRGRRIAGRAQDDHVIDTYKLRRKLPDPTRCPRCGATYHAGRWQWMSPPPTDAQDELCTACRRIEDAYPAGIVTLSGPLVRQHRSEMLSLTRNLEEAEKAEHPLNRIMAIDHKTPERIVITTTDIHLPRRIGEAVRRAFHGDLKTHYDSENYFVRVEWTHAER